MLKKLSDIIDQINLHRDIIPPLEKVRPSITVGSNEDDVFSLKPIHQENTFNSVGLQKIVILRYGINKDFANSMTNSFQTAELFIKLIEQSVMDTLNHLTSNNIRLTQQITFKYPNQEYSVLALEDGNFELRVYCRILL